MTRPTRDVVLMQTAKAFAKRSTCSRAHVGAVFSRDGRILATGYNGAPAGMPHCTHRLPSVQVIGEDTPVDRGCEISVHAEANGIAWAARNGVGLEHCEVHTTLAPCVACAMLLVNAGAFRVVYLVPYRDARGRNLLEQAGISTEAMFDFP